MTSLDTDMFAAARARWPDVDFGSVDLERVRGADPAHRVELLLALACLARDASALRHFEREFLAEVLPVARRLMRDEAAQHELLQLTRLRLLVSDGRPRLAEYAGRGSLGGWVKAVATRLGLNELKALARTEAREEPVEQLPEVDLEQDPTLLVLRERHREDFTAALRTGWARLTAQQRTVLQMNLLDGVSIDRIGAVFGAHRATAARWLEKARADLLDATRAALAERLSLSPNELESLLRAVGSQLDVSVRSIMRG
jgi:RNA polymerase sigma-70 factor (ECF subfamily)